MADHHLLHAQQTLEDYSLALHRAIAASKSKDEAAVHTTLAKTLECHRDILLRFAAPNVPWEKNK